MNWNLAVEKNHEALRCILAMLVAMIGIAGRDRPATLPRHLHRFVLRLLRPAEAATRRLIIVAAQGLTVKFRPHRPRNPKVVPEPRIIYVLDRVNGSIVNVPVVLPEPVPVSPPHSAKRPSLPAFPLLDPVKCFGVRRRYAKPSASPQIRMLGAADDPVVQFSRRHEPAPPPPPAPTPDDPLDAGHIHRRLDALALALDDLPRQAKRMARWQARRDARLAREKGRDEVGQGNDMSTIPVDRPPLRFASQTTSPPFDGGEEKRRQGLAPFLYPREAGGEVARAKPETEWGDFQPAPSSPQMGPIGVGRSGAEGPQPQRRFHRLSPMRPGRPPGWRRKPNHDVYEVLNELHGLAVWASERRDSS